jgi:hypothetical protein
MFDNFPYEFLVTALLQYVGNDDIENLLHFLRRISVQFNRKKADKKCFHLQSSILDTIAQTRSAFSQKSMDSSYLNTLRGVNWVRNSALEFHRIRATTQYDKHHPINKSNPAVRSTILAKR